MAKKLAAFVHVNGKVLGPDDDVSAEDAKAITNPRAWGEEPQSEDKAPAKKSASSKNDK